MSVDLFDFGDAAAQCAAWQAAKQLEMDQLVVQKAELEAIVGDEKYGQVAIHELDCHMKKMAKLQTLLDSLQRKQDNCLVELDDAQKAALEAMKAAAGKSDRHFKIWMLDCTDLAASASACVEVNADENLSDYQKKILWCDLCEHC